MKDKMCWYLNNIKELPDCNDWVIYYGSVQTTLKVIEWKNASDNEKYNTYMFYRNAWSDDLDYQNYIDFLKCLYNRLPDSVKFLLL